MKALDTSVLIRFLVRDDEKQAGIAYGLFKQAESRKETLFIPLLVVLETVWVLESVYRISRQEILDAVDALLLMPVLEFEAQSVAMNFVSSARETGTDLSDLPIAHSVKAAGCESVLTFDKRASSSGFFELLG